MLATTTTADLGPLDLAALTAAAAAAARRLATHHRPADQAHFARLMSHIYMRLATYYQTHADEIDPLGRLAP